MASTLKQARRLAGAALLTAAMAGCAPAPPPATPEPAVRVATPPEKASAATSLGSRLVEAKCATCHGLDVAVGGRRSAAHWRQILDDMVGHGMVASEEELRALQIYLAAEHGTGG